MCTAARRGRRRRGCHDRPASSARWTPLRPNVDEPVRSVAESAASNRAVRSWRGRCMMRRACSAGRRAGRSSPGRARPRRRRDEDDRAASRVRPGAARAGLLRPGGRVPRTAPQAARRPGRAQGDGSTTSSAGSCSTRRRRPATSSAARSCSTRPAQARRLHQGQPEPPEGPRGPGAAGPAARRARPPGDAPGRRDRGQGREGRPSSPRPGRSFDQARDRLHRGRGAGSRPPSPSSPASSPTTTPARTRRSGPTTP